MQTDRLIAALAADANTAPRRIGPVLTLALLAALPVSVALFMSILGMRPDVRTAMHNPFFDLKFVVTSVLAFTAIVVSLHLTRPEASFDRWGWLLVLPVVVIILGIGAEMMMPHQRPWLTRLIGNNAMACMASIPLFSLPFLAAALLALRRGAPAHPALAGMTAGLLAAGLGATLYASHCADDSPLFVMVWYSLATAFVAAVGAFVGRRVLRY
ncbi:MAG: DUF1109 domain-containing protein [Rhizobiales bacterium]|nr:DUF1109 domain-containing protein [Hyphomicrobiales bacterium]